VVLALGALAFWSSPSKALEHCGPDTGHQADAKVILKDTSYQPATVTLTAAGQSVCWEHQDGQTPHSITSDSPPGASDHFDFPQDGNRNPTCTPSGDANDCFQQGDQPWKLLLNSPGTFPYHCKIHPNMKGTIVVQGGGGGPATTRATTATTQKSNSTTTVGSLSQDTTTTVAEESTTSTSETSSSTTSTSINFTTQTTVPGQSALSQNDDDDEPSGVLKAVGVVLLLASIAGLIPAWRRLT
jgi:plastocyanin